MNIKPVNRRALRRYGEFWRALQQVDAALEQAERLAAAAADQTPVRTQRWSAAKPEELRAAAKKAGKALRVMATSAKRWEAELVSRDWRK